MAMASNIALDFECPQFVDFAAELDGSSKDDMFFDCVDHQSPEDETMQKCPEDCVGDQNPEDETMQKCPEENVFDEQHPINEEESRLLSKLEASLSIFTPKLKVGSVRKQLLVEKFPNTLCAKVRPICKPNTIPLPAQLPRSKSVACFNKILGANTTKAKGFRKRSSSLGDLKPHKKQTYPMTPMCLKRTIAKAKNKVLKTTEERELEEIAKLQNQLKQHLRYNEITLRRLNLKPKPSAYTQNTEAKTENVKGLNAQMERLNVGEKRTRQNIQKVNLADLKKVAEKVNAVIKNPAGGITVVDKQNVGKSKCLSVASVASDLKEGNNIKENESTKSKCLSVSSTVSDIQGNKSQVIKTVPSKKLGYHSGIVFHDVLNKKTPKKTFCFDVKIREKINSAKPDVKIGVSQSNSLVKPVMEGKENIPQNKAFSTVKNTKMRNSNCDIVKQVQINKKNFDKFAKKSIKGYPLSENLARNK